MPSPTEFRLPGFDYPGWHLIGAYPDGDPGDTGSWLLHNGGEALLLEVPEGLTVSDVAGALDRTGFKLRYVAASHDHYDHIDPEVWDALAAAFPRAKFIHPTTVRGDRMLRIGGEPLWLVKGPKHSACDVVTVFRGVAMTGDIETGTLDSVTDEVPLAKRRRSMRRLAGFQERTGYRVHTTISAHMNSVRRGVDWESLFRVDG
jgi:hypothetical protein